MATLITGIALGLAALFVIYRSVKKAKAAPEGGCGGHCSGCPGCGVH